MTDEEILDLARRGYKELGITPAARACFACVLGAAMQAVGKKWNDHGLAIDAAKAFGKPIAWGWGVTSGFDGEPCDPLQLNKAEFQAGYDFGKTAAAEFLK